MSLPQAKRAKLSFEDHQTFSFTKKNEACDRKLLVGNCIFRVHSQTLIDHSDYFRVMFTSDFREKNKKEIEIEGVDTNEMEMFLSVIFEPEDIDVDKKDLFLLCKVFSFFHATTCLVHFFKEKQVFHSCNKFVLRELLELSVEHGIPDLKEAVDAHLAYDYTHNTKHAITTETKYIRLMSKYNLKQLKDVIELYVIELFKKDPTIRRRRELLDCYLKAANPVKMDKLKEAVEIYYTNLYDEENEDFMEVVHLTSEVVEYNLTNALNNIETMSIAMLEREKSLEEFNICSLRVTKRMPKLKEAIEELLLKQMKSDEEVYSDFLRDCCEYSTSHGTDKLKDAVEEFMIRTLENDREIERNIITIYGEYSEKHGRDKIKEAIEKYFIKKLKNHENLSDFIIKQCSYFSEKFKMETLKNEFETYLINDFQSSRSFKNIKFAFIGASGYGTCSLSDCIFKAFRESMTEFFQFISFDDPIIKNGHTYLLELPDTQTGFIFKTMLRRYDDE